MARAQSPVGRTHDKLGAALQRFGIAGAIRGQRILDINGSTPGFAAVLLELGAAHVASVSIGPTPLTPALRSDRRVSIFERVHVKSMQAAQAPGPFSFFTVDVRFASARSMLRAVAFRAAPPTHGIVYVRPQSEAALEHKNRSLTGAALRARALAQFSEKATSLGFQILAEADGAEGDEAQVVVHLLLPV